MVLAEHAVEKMKTSKSHAKVIPNLRNPMDFKGKVQQKVRHYTENVHKSANKGRTVDLLRNRGGTPPDGQYLNRSQFVTLVVQLLCTVGLFV